MNDYQYLAANFNIGILTLSEIRAKWDEIRLTEARLDDLRLAVKLVKDYWNTPDITDCGDFTLTVVPWEA